MKPRQRGSRCFAGTASRRAACPIRRPTTVPHGDLDAEASESDMTEHQTPDLLRMLLRLEDLPPGYHVTSELRTEDAAADDSEAVEGRALDARSVEYTTEDGGRVLQASVVLNADA